MWWYFFSRKKSASIPCGPLLQSSVARSSKTSLLNSCRNAVGNIGVGTHWWRYVTFRMILENSSKPGVCSSCGRVFTGTLTLVSRRRAEKISQSSLCRHRMVHLSQCRHISNTPADTRNWDRVAVVSPMEKIEKDPKSCPYTTAFRRPKHAKECARETSSSRHCNDCEMVLQLSNAPGQWQREEPTLKMSEYKIRNR